jgi:hypothetical protein
VEEVRLKKCWYNSNIFNVLKPLISPTYRRWATITDINYKNQVSCVLIFSDTVNLSKLEHFPFFWDTTFISAIPYCVLFPGNWVFGNCIFAMRNPHFGSIVYFGYEGTTEDYCIYLLVILNIFKSQNCRYLPTIR